MEISCRSELVSTMVGPCPVMSENVPHDVLGGPIIKEKVRT